jgi:3-deoxy-D-manno-octulosonate cytidylyltransferase
MSAAPFAIVLPARFHSTRFPGKPLADVCGRPLIEWTYRRAQAVEGAGLIVVATDDESIARAVERFGGNAVMTAPTHRTGTERVAEVAETIDYDIIVNLQADEPVVPHGLIEDMAKRLDRSPELDIVTACHGIVDQNELENPHAVKVVMSTDLRAIYFSRSPIPYGIWKGGHDYANKGRTAYRHIGIYAFRRESLIAFAAMEPSPLEEEEGLEQLRALENGMAIGLVISEKSTLGVDTPDDLKNVEKELLSN